MSPRRVLIVDDDPALLEALPETVALRMSDVVVDTCDSAAAAIERLAETDYDAIVTDIKMPGIDGLALLAEIRRRRPDTPTLLITGHGEHDLAVRALRGGAYDYISKPIDREYFVMALGRAIHVRELAGEVKAQRIALERHARELQHLVDDQTRALSTQLADMRRLHELGMRLGKTLELQPVLHETLGAVTSLLDTDAGALVLGDRGRRDVSIVASTGLGRPELELLRQVLSEVDPPCHDASIMLSGDGVAPDPAYKDVVQIAQRAGYAAVHATAMVSRTGDVAGTILLFVRERGAVSDRQARLVELYARYASDLIENARLYREARAANQAKDDFLATLSHELRTPLTAILGWARLLRSGRLDESTQREALAVIERNATAQAKLVDDLLDVSRIIAGKLRIEREPVRLRTVVDAAADAIRPSADGKRIALTCEWASGPFLVRGDAERLQQVVWNLLSNAVKFTGSGGHVHVCVRRDSDRAVLTVRDTGKGIAAEFLPHIFDRFRQADSSITRASDGLGLGLALARHLVEVHRGTMWAESAGPGQGSTFGVALPLIVTDLADDDRVERPDVAAPDRARATAPDLRGVRVLAVDDHRDSLELVVATLSQAGAEIRSANSVSGAFTVFRSWRPDVVVSDLGMPDEDGYSFIQRIRTLDAGRGSPVAALALTAWARPEDRARTTAAGYDAHVPKPVDPHTLVRLVQVLARR